MASTMLEHLQVKQCKIIIWRNLIFCLLVIIVAFSYFYKINLFPQPDYDEALLLNIPYRLVNFGDAYFTAGLREAFNSDGVRKYPPITSFWLRNVMHWTIGFSPLKSRVISAFLILTVVIVAGGIIPAWLFKNKWLTLLPLVAVGLNPNVFMGARSVRFEQEIAFLGVLGILGIPFLIKFIESRWLRIFLMVIGGLMVGWAATSHPWGMVFLAVLVFTLLFYTDAWQAQDGVGFKTRLVAWGCGIIIPGAILISAMLVDWQNYTAYLSAVSKVYATQERVAANVAKVPWLAQYLPDWLAAHYPPLYHYISHYQAFYPYYKTFRILFLIEVLVLIGFALYALYRRQQEKNIFVILATWLAIGFIIMFFVYPPSSNYFLYPAMTISLGFAFVALYLWEKIKTETLASRVIRYGSLMILLGVAAANGTFFLGQMYLLMSPDKTNNLISLDTRFQAIQKMADITGMNSQEKPVLCDFSTWIGGGYNHGSLWETGMLLLTPVPKNYGGIILELPVYEKFMFSYGNRMGITKEQNLERTKELLAPLRLTGVIFDKFSNKSYHYYKNHDRLISPLMVGIIAGEKNILWRAVPPDNAQLPAHVSGEGVSGWRNLPEGFYLLEPFHSDATECIVKVYSPGSQHLLYDIKIPPSLFYRYVRRLVLIEVPQGGADIDVIAGKGVSEANLTPLLEDNKRDLSHSIKSKQ